jgi:LAO/AO transport system kinase
VSAVESNLSLHEYGPQQWRPPIVKTVATTGVGIPELVDAIQRFREHPETRQSIRRRVRSEARVRELVAERLMKHLETHVLPEGAWAATIARVNAREIDPYTAADQLVRHVVAGSTRL